MTTTTNASRRLWLVALVQLVLLGTFVSYLNTAVMVTTASGMNGRSLTVQDGGIRDNNHSNTHIDPNSLVEKVKLVHPKPTKRPPPEMAWLLSYPNRYEYCGRLFGSEQYSPFSRR